MKKLALTFTTLALALGASAVHAAPTTKTFQCEKQFKVSVKPAGKDKIRIHVANPMNKGTILKLSPSGSGELYANAKGIYGKPTELHIKGKQAHFSFTDPYNNEVGVACRSR